MAKPLDFGSARPPVVSNLRFFFLANTSFASLSASGAMTTSVRMPVIASAVAPSIGWFKAIIPPNALVRSQSKARLYASASVGATARPHGLACLIIAHAGPFSGENSLTSSKAASVSLMLL